MNDSRYRILLVEDDPVDQLAFIRLVESENLPYDHIIAGSVAEAKQIIEREQLDLLILDYRLKDGTAFDILDRLTQDLPCLVVTGSGDEEIAVRAMRKGVYDYLTKDLKRAYLSVLPISIENALKRKDVEDQSQMLFHALMSIHDSVFISDMDEKVVFVNNAFQEVYGYQFDEIVGASTSILGEMGWKGEYVHHRKDGSQVPVSVTRSIVRDAGGREVAKVGVARDISERKKVQEQLTIQKELFKNLVEIARATAKEPSLETTLKNALEIASSLTGSELGSVFLVDEQGEVLQSILARGRYSDLSTRPLVDRVMDRGLAGWVVRNRQPALLFDTLEDERWLRSPFGDYHPRSALSVPITIQETVIGVLTLTHHNPGVFSKEHLNLIQAAADQMALAIRNAQMFDEQRRFADLQVNLYRLLRTVGSLLDPETVAKVAVDEIVEMTGWNSVGIVVSSEGGERLMMRAHAGQKVVPDDWSLGVGEGVIGTAYKTQTRQYHTYMADGEALQSEAENLFDQLAIPIQRVDHLLGILAVETEDGTCFNRGDIQLAESLAEAVGLALENARLFKESKKTAERLRELDRLKSSFLANMSHELRTPLNAILGYSELLQEDAEEMGFETFVADLENIERGGKHLLAVINDILDFSKIEAGRMDLFLEKFDIQSLIDDVLITVQPLFEKNDNELFIEHPSQLGEMKADPTKVRQILINLLSNASKFTRQGKVMVEISREVNDELDWIVFRVEDTGIGISNRQLETLFQPFIQGDISTTRKYGGTGLGLAITRGFCQMMGGDIFVESTVGKGSVFTVRIPEEVEDFSTELD